MSAFNLATYKNKEVSVWLKLAPVFSYIYIYIYILLKCVLPCSHALKVIAVNQDPLGKQGVRVVGGNLRGGARNRHYLPS